MPIIKLETGKLEKEVKEELIKTLTKTCSQITKIPREFFVVLIDEYPDENFAVGGKTIDIIKKEVLGE